MPEAGSVVGDGGNGPPIPPLFPNSLSELCCSKVLNMLRGTGTRVEREAGEGKYVSYYDQSYQDLDSFPYTSVIWPSPSPLTRLPPASSFTVNEEAPEPQVHVTQTQVFNRCATICRDFLSNLLVGSVLDTLSEAARQVANPNHPGHTFIFSVLCCDRLGRLVVHLHTDRVTQRSLKWAKFLSQGPGEKMLRDSLAECSGLSSLYLHHLATNSLLYCVSNTCRRLTLLDISYSDQVTDIGLVHLCGMLSGTTRCLQSAPVGCKYLRELYFNPQGPGTGIDDQIMPRVISCLLRHLPNLQVVDLTNLHPGIQHYYRGAGSATSRESSNQRYGRVKPLNLVHYTGSDRLAEVMDICPKLRTFKLFVTDALPELGITLKSLDHQLEQVTLVYSADYSHLRGFQDFLSACGRKLCRLDIECPSSTIFSCSDLTAIAAFCPNIEALSFNSFHVEAEIDPRISHSPVPTTPASFPFLSSVRLSNVTIEQNGKDVFRYLIGGAPDLESIYVSFESPGFFFSDFLLDDILLVNNLSHLQEFILRDGALTLISALRLISSRPKLRTVGRLLNWDVEPSELTTFIQILRKAKSLNLLQDITII